MPTLPQTLEPVNPNKYRRPLRQWITDSGIGEHLDYAELYRQLFSPDPADSPEFSRSNLTPEQSLWWAVLRDAIDIFLGRPRDRYRIAPGEWDRVSKWILSDDPRPRSFVFACEALRINPEAARKVLVDQRRSILEVEW